MNRPLDPRLHRRSALRSLRAIVREDLPAADAPATGRFCWEGWVIGAVVAAVVGNGIYQLLALTGVVGG